MKTARRSSLREEVPVMVEDLKAALCQLGIDKFIDLESATAKAMMTQAFELGRSMQGQVAGPGPMEERVKAAYIALNQGPAYRAVIAMQASSSTEVKVAVSCAIARDIEARNV